MKKSKNSMLSIIVLVLLSLSVPASAWAKASLEKIRIGQSLDKTRVVFEVKKNNHFKISTLDNPPRIVVDFYNTKNKIKFKQKKFLDSRLGKIRIKDQPKRTRIVLDLRKRFNYKYFVLAKNKNGSERVVIDLSKKVSKKNLATQKTKRIITTALNSIEATKIRRIVAKKINSLAKANAQKIAKSKAKRVALARAKFKKLEVAKANRIALSLAKFKKLEVAKANRIALSLAKFKKLEAARAQRVALAKSKKLKAAKAKRVALAKSKKLKLIKANRLVLAKAKTTTVKSKPKPLFKLQPTKDFIVAIDAGHGGKDTGAIGYNNTLEKVVVLQLAKKLKKNIDSQPGMRAILTRDKDVFISLQERVQIAKKKNADIFISLHADSFPDKSARGGSVYVLSTKGASSVMASLLAKSQNASLNGINLKGRDRDVAFILSDLTRSANISASQKLGRSVLGEMGLAVKLHKSSVQSANFVVLKSIDMPSLLIETAFVSNPNEARNLKSSRFQTKMAKSIVRGLTKFAKVNANKPRWGETLYVKYKVQYGDTLSQIADNYGISTKQLKKINKIKKSNQLYVGRRLKIPISEDIIATL